MSRRITIAGRTFVLAGQTTIAHDLHAMALVRKAGLEELRLLPGETTEGLARRVLYQAVESGVALELLGALVVPEERDPLTWSVELGHETAAFLGSLSSDGDKAVVNGLIASALADFLRAALQSSSGSAAGSTDQQDERPPGNGGDRQGPSANGAASSGSSEGTITTARNG